MRQNSVRILSAAVAATMLMVSFQNCGKAGFDGADDASLDLGSSLQSTGTPFAYDATFDQISYNSCAVNTLAGYRGYYSLMAGAYDTGGVWATQEFLNYVNNGSTIKPVYPATTVSSDQIKQFLAVNPENLEARPQMALRTRTNVQQLRAPGSQGLTEGLDYITMLGDLTDDRWMHPLVTGAGNHSLFFNLAPDDSRSLEARLTYNKDEGIAQGLRNDLMSSGMLALTFKERSDLGASTAVRSPVPTDTRKGYGRGYNLTFEASISYYTTLIRGSGAMPNNLNPNNILTAIQEVDLRNPSVPTTTSWSCPQARRYVVVQPKDKAAYCPNDPFSDMADANYRREYEIVRRHLKPEQWDVSVRYRCVVPKESSCYPAKESDGSDTIVQYDQTQVCYQAIQGIPYSGTPPRARCAQYVSFCNRN